MGKKESPSTSSSFLPATGYEDDDDGLILDFVIDAGMYVCVYMYVYTCEERWTC